MGGKPNKTKKKGSLKPKGPKASKVVTKKTHQQKKPAALSAKDATQIGLTDLAVILFGESAIEEVKKQGMDVRELWNMSTNITQCNNVIGEVVYGTSSCWICGEVIEQREGLEAECEHILPVAQAVIFLSLYSAKKKKNYTEGFEKLLSLEYGWAHTVCNQEKTDICCIGNDGYRAIVLDNSVEFILKKIYNSSRVNSSSIKNILKTKYNNLKSFVDGRSKIMRQKYEAIVNYLNPTNGENRFKLTILAGLITAIDPSFIREDAHQYLSPEFIKQKQVEKEIFKTLMDEKIKKDVDDQLGLTEKLNKMLLLNAVLTLDQDIKFLFDKIRAQFKSSWINSDKTNSWISKTFIEDSRHVQIYYTLYNKIAFLSTNKNKNYDTKEAILNTKNCITSYLVIKYCEYIIENIVNNKRMTATIKENNIDTVNKIIAKYKGVINKFNGIYEFIDEYYKNAVAAIEKSELTSESMPINNNAVLALANMRNIEDYSLTKN